MLKLEPVLGKGKQLEPIYTSLIEFESSFAYSLCVLYHIKSSCQLLSSLGDHAKASFFYSKSLFSSNYFSKLNHKKTKLFTPNDTLQEVSYCGPFTDYCPEKTSLHAQRQTQHNTTQHLVVRARFSDKSAKL